MGDRDEKTGFGNSAREENNVRGNIKSQVVQNKLTLLSLIEAKLHWIAVRKNFCLVSVLRGGKSLQILRERISYVAFVHKVRSDTHCRAIQSFVFESRLLWPEKKEWIDFILVFGDFFLFLFFYWISSYEKGEKESENDVIQ